MHNTLSQRIKTLPHGEVLAPLRLRWPKLLGMVAPVVDDRWAVIITNGVADPPVNMVDVALEVDKLFEQLGLSGYVRAKRIEGAGYTFVLVESLLDKRPQTPVTAL